MEKTESLKKYEAKYEKEYRKMIEKYRKKESERMLTNLSSSHAKILFENLLKSAEEHREEVCIYSGTLHKDFYNDLEDAVKEALEKTRVLVAVADDKDLEGNAFAEAVKASPNGKLKTGVKSPIGNSFPHFILVGETRYRFEYDDVLKRAVASFNDPVLGDMLTEAKLKLFPEKSPESQAADGG